MYLIKSFMFAASLLLLVQISSTSDFEDHEDIDQHHKDDNKPIPKDKVLLKDIKTLTFLRNKRTTSRRTHSIHQLSCVGGTAGCKMFTPEIVECLNSGFNEQHRKYDWKCHAEMSDRVVFNHVEVICEGYDYPEDDHILLGSCGLEFTLDYVDPHDSHEKSYFQHMDSHEKEMHVKKVTEKHGPPKSSSFVDRIIGQLSNHVLLIVAFIVLVLCSLILVRFLTNSSGGPLKKKRPQKGSSYGPLTSAVMTTKKAC